MRDPSAIELVFEGLAVLKWLPAPADYEDIISEGWLYRVEDMFCWADAEPGVEANRLIVGRCLWWRDASDWMGEEQRLGLPWNPAPANL